MPSGAPGYPLCQASWPAFVPAHFYVLASGYPFLGTDPPLARQGTTGAEFRIEGIPADRMYAAVVAGPGGVVEGDFFGAGGRVSFAECRPWETGSCLVLLLDVMVIPLQPVSDGTIFIRPLVSSCGVVESTFLSLCDPPVATRLCSLGGRMCFNSTIYCPYCPLSHAADECTLPVAPTTWSGLKELFH